MMNYRFQVIIGYYSVHFSWIKDVRGKLKGRTGNDKYAMIDIFIRFITQPSLKEQIVVSRQVRPSTIKIKEVPFQFIYHNEKHFFGTKKIWIDNFNKVVCSDLEKTIIGN